MFTLALRNLFRQKARTLMTLLAITFGVSALVVSGGFVEDIYIQLRDITIHTRLGYLQVYERGYYEFGTRDPYEYIIEQPERVIERTADIPGVVDVLERIRFFGLLDNGRADRAIIAEGVEPAKEAVLSNQLTILDGRRLTGEDEFAVEVGEGVAEALALSVGDYVNLTATTTDGGMNSLELEVTAVFRTFSKEFDARAVRLPLATAQSLLDTGGVHALVYSLTGDEATAPVRAAIRERLGTEAFEVFSWYDLDEFYRKVVDLYQKQFGFLQLIMLGIVLLSVANSVSMTAQERVGEFGTLRAVGMTSSSVYRLIILENTLLALLGAALGVGVGWLLAQAISAIGIPMPPPPNSNSGYTAMIRIEPQILLTAAAIGAVATVLSAIIAGRGPSRRPVADALRENI